MKCRHCIILLVALAFVSSVHLPRSHAAHPASGFRQVPQVAAGGGGATFLFQESFEGTGYENSWTEDLGTPDEDDTSPVAQGSQSFAYGTGVRLTLNTTWAAPATCYNFFAFYPTTSTTTDDALLGRNGTTTIWTLQRRSDTAFRINHGGAFVDTATFADGQWIYFWLDYTAGTGANGTMDIYISTTTTKPGSPTHSITTGTSTLGQTQFYIRCDEAGNVFNLDYMKVDDVPIGSAP